MNLKAPKVANPFSSSTEEEKEILNHRLNLYKDQLDDQWSGIKTGLAEHGKNAAVIGGVVLGVFGIMNALLPEAIDEEEESGNELKKAGAVAKPQRQPAFGVPLTGAIQSLVWTLAMNWARQRVKDFVSADKSANI